MGACGSNEVNEAIKKDGPENVKKAAISRAGQRQAQRYYDELAKKYPDYLKDKQRQKLNYIDKKKDDLEERAKEIHRKVQAEKPNSIQKLQQRNKKPFKQIIGYNKTSNDIETYRSKVNKVFEDQQAKLNKDLKTQSQRTSGQVEKSEPQLTNISRFGVDRKGRILKDQEGNYHNQIEKNNQTIRDNIDKQWGYNKIYKERFESKAPDSELEQILKQFQDNVPSMATMKGGCCS